VWFGESKKQSEAPQTPVMVELDDSDGDLPF